MLFSRRSLRLAVSVGPGVARLRWKGAGDPELEAWDPDAEGPSIRGVDSACDAAEGIPFLHLDLRTPYGESVSEDQVLHTLREALGPKSEEYQFQGWHVAHLEDTHLGSNHRVFVSLRRGTAENGGLWDQRLPLELAVEALGDWLARTTGKSLFQLVLRRGPWVYSLAYSRAQPYHLMRVADSPRDHALRRLAAHRRYLRQQSKEGGEIPVFLEDDADWRERCAQALECLTEPIPSPPVAAGSVGEGPGLWHFGLALAALRPENDAHNLAPESRRDRNVEIRLGSRLVKAAMAAAALGLAVLGVEGLRYVSAGRALSAARLEVERYAGPVADVRQLRRERRELAESLASLRPLWKRPVPLDRILRDLGDAFPGEGGMEGLLLRAGTGSEAEISFKAWVRDWNQVRPLQENFRKIPYLASVDFSDQRKDPERGRVHFQAVCALRGAP